MWGTGLSCRRPPEALCDWLLEVDSLRHLRTRQHVSRHMGPGHLLLKPGCRRHRETGIPSLVQCILHNEGPGWCSCRTTAKLAPHVTLKCAIDRMTVGTLYAPQGPTIGYV